jgi:hypothetical protein
MIRLRAPDVVKYSGHMSQKAHPFSIWKEHRRFPTFDQDDGPRFNGYIAKVVLGVTGEIPFFCHHPQAFLNGGIILKGL